MTQYDNNNRGALFKNLRKTTDKHPDFTGELTVNDVIYQMAGWMKKSKNGQAYMSITIQPAQAKTEQTEQTEIKEVDPDIPF